jgi:DUF4097 and DUF4098 domain-containing protein YvlB
MKDHHYKKRLADSLPWLLMVLPGCSIHLGCVPAEKYTTVVHRTAPLSAGSDFAATTHNGSITIIGANVTEVALTATIVARAETEQAAKKLADLTQVKLRPSGGNLTVEINKPPLARNQSVSVSLDANVPEQTNLDLVTHNGDVTVDNIMGQTNAETHNGKVTVADLVGSTRLKTHNGSVRCNQVAGPLQVHTHNGGVKASHAPSASSECDVSIEAHNGSVEFRTAPGLSARVELSTYNGSINTDLPITVVGAVTKSKLSGTIGTGKGRIRLKTYNGSIRIR